MGSVDLGEDVGGRLGPDVGGRVNVVSLDMLLDSGDEIRDAAKDTSSQLLLGEVTEEPFDHVEPRRTGGREVDMKAGMVCEPPLNGRLFVGRVVINDEMEIFVLGCLAIDEL